jgi:hypothetical protein
MSDFDTYTCESCGGEFKANPDAEAASSGYCSPACQNEGEGLA